MKVKTALILCAGLGKRLNPITLQKPKPLLELNNITLLENTINLIKKLGIKKIFLNTFHLKDQIKDYLNNKNFNISINIVEDGSEILDTGGGIKNMINNSNEENFLIFNPDTVWNINYLKSIIQMNEFFENNDIKNILLVVNKKLSFEKKFNGLLNKIVRKKVNKRFGGSLKALVSGGAALNFEVGIYLVENFNKVRLMSKRFAKEKGGGGRF